MTIRRTLDEIYERASWELIRNDSITSYICLDDYVWRRPANPLLKLEDSVKKLGAYLVAFKSSAGWTHEHRS